MVIVIGYKLLRTRKFFYLNFSLWKQAYDNILELIWSVTSMTYKRIRILGNASPIKILTVIRNLRSLEARID